MPWLVQLNEQGGSVKSWPLDDHPTTFGRGDDANACIDDQLMSRHHFVVSHDKGRYLIADQKSTNGTWVNGRRTDTATLHENDQVRAGNTRFLYHVGTATMLGQVEEKAGQKFHDVLQDIYRKADKP